MKKNGITFGAFDLLHAGHVLFLECCKEQCDHLTVGLHVDPSIENPNKNKPAESVTERIIKLSGCRFVDDIVVYETEKDISTLLLISRPFLDYYFVGQDHENDIITGEGDFEGDIIFVPRNHNFSSSELRGRIERNKNGWWF